MEQNDTRIFSYFVVDHAPVEGMVFCFVDLQRTRHFLEEKKNMSLLFQVFVHFLYFSLFFFCQKCTEEMHAAPFQQSRCWWWCAQPGTGPCCCLCLSSLCISAVHLDSCGPTWRKGSSSIQKKSCRLRVAPNAFFFLSFVNLVLLLHYATRPSKTQGQCFLSVFSTRRRESGWVSGGSRKRQAASVRKRLLQTREQDRNNRKRGQRLRKIWLWCVGRR